MVLLVVVFHSGASYGSAVDFWPFHDADPSRAIDLFMFLVDVFAMAVLFFVAGYFALPSLQRKGPLRFCRDKLKRLGLPWLAITLLVLPVLDYVHYRHGASGGTDPFRGFGEHWLLSLSRMADFRVGWMKMNVYSDMTQHFYQRYMWYLSLLLLFFLLFALCHAFLGRRDRPAERPVEKRLSEGSVFLPLALTAALTILLFSAVKFGLYSDFLDKGWFSLGNVVQFQWGKLVIYACYFALGVYGRSRDWCAGGKSMERPWKWGAACLLLFCVNMYVLAKLNAGSGIPGLRLAFVVLYPLWTLSFLGLFLSLAASRLNMSTPVSRSLSANSYNMYLVHYPVPMIMPLLLAGWTGAPAAVKFGIVALTALALSYGFGRYVIMPFPRAVVAGLIVLSITLALVT